MANARSIINSAARKISVLGRGQTMPADEVNDALGMLNAFLDTLSAEGAVIYASTRESFPLNGAQSYTIGAGGDFNTSRPMEFDAVFIRTGGIDYPLTKKGAAEYASIAFKTVTGIPDTFYYDNNSPLSRLFLYPVGVAGYELHLWAKKAITKFADLTTSYDLPPGVEEMLVYNLAVRMCPEYEKPVPADVAKQAKASKTAVEVYLKRQDYPTSTIDLADNVASEGNIFSGWNTR